MQYALIYPFRWKSISCIFYRDRPPPQYLFYGAQMVQMSEAIASRAIAELLKIEINDVHILLSNTLLRSLAFHRLTIISKVYL